ncbi:MAG: hypothetical protein IKC09_01190 [Oscillospiraceae bacterium]|nr:hypothetical protein [Oscillospiraceae bacterium]
MARQIQGNTDATKQMLDEVRKVKTKLTKEKNAFKNAMEIVGIKTESEINLFGPNAVSRVADIATAVRKASDRLYTACQTQIPLLDALCRPLLDQDPSTKAVKEVTALIQKLNKESEISTNFRGNINGGTFYDLVGVRYLPSLENQMIQRFWEERYSQMPDTAAEDQAYAARERKEKQEQASLRTRALLEVMQAEREAKQQKKLAQEQERQNRLARIAENAEETLARREYLRRAREMVGINGSTIAWTGPGGKLTAQHRWGYASPGDISEFYGIRSVVCTNDGIVGLRNSGACMTTVPFSDCKSNLRDVENWHGIEALAAGEYHVVGLRKDGTCVATSFKRGALMDRGQSNVASWTDVVEIACGDDFTLGLRKDGTVLYAGADGSMAEKINKLTDIDMIAASGIRVIAVTKKGEILFGNGAMNKAENVVQVAVAGEPYALQADGTLLGGAENMLSWRRDETVVVDRNVVALFSGRWLHYLKEDGTLVKVGYKEPAVKERLFESYDAYWQAQEEADRIRQEKVRQVLAWREAGVCQHCGGSFRRGLFGSKCGSCGKKKDY